MTSVENKLTKIIQARLKTKKNIKKLGIGIHSNWDSLFHLSLLLEVEKKFQIKFTMKEMTEINNFLDIVSKIKKYKK